MGGLNDLVLPPSDYATPWMITVSSEIRTSSLLNTILRSTDIDRFSGQYILYPSDLELYPMKRLFLAHVSSFPAARSLT